jgi:hypothetical protein
MMPEIHSTEALLHRHCVQLQEHFDNVVILVSRRGDHGDTDFAVLGHGNYYACYGMARRWVLDQEGSMYRGETQEQE